MRIASWSWGGRPHVGLVSPDGRELTPLAVRTPERGAFELVHSLAHGDPLPPAAGPRLPLEAVTLRAPLRPRRNVFCIGRNYRSHAEELSTSVFRDAVAASRERELWPIVFTKVPETVIGPHDVVRLPGAAITEQIDYESELVVVIGKGGINIARSRAMEHVFGYTVCNDVSARDVQTRHQQWHLGKSLDTFCPMGPCIVTADELDGTNTRVRGWVTPAGGSAELRQEASTKDMIFDIPSQIEHISRGITLYPGDLIATGTMSGVGMGFTPPKWLRHGDVVRIEVDGLGAIENRFEER
ncbi:MAG: fumarylacetoacetate hydrolase family protein [Rubrivivax sp.]|nr:fumarylacetoacetate hydrolase family protein [Rubrivivax sp.]